MFTPPRVLLLVGALSALNACPPLPPQDTPTPTPTYTPTYSPTPDEIPSLDFDPAQDASISCDERGWHVTLDITGWTEVDPPPLFGMYDIPNGEDRPVYQELHPIYLMDTFDDPYYETLYLDLSFTEPDAEQIPGTNSLFDCRREEVLSFQFCSYDFFYPSPSLHCWAWGLAPDSVPTPDGF